jgi:hypothetical protein
MGRRRLSTALERALTPEQIRLQIVGSAGDVKDRADLPWLEARDQSAGLFRRDSDKVSVSARSLLHHLGHDRQRAVSPGADDQAGSAPGNLLVGRERSVSELVAVWLRGLLAPLAHRTSIDDDVVRPRPSLDLDRPESEKSHIHYLPGYPSPARATGHPQLLPDKLAAEGRPCPNALRRKVFACSTACRINRYQQTVEQSVSGAVRSSPRDVALTIAHPHVSSRHTATGIGMAPTEGYSAGQSSPLAGDCVSRGIACRPTRQTAAIRPLHARNVLLMVTRLNRFLRV